MTVKRPNRETIFVFLMLSAFTWACTDESNNAVDAMAEREELSVLYFYPSTLRMLGKLVESENKASFREIERARVIFTWENETDLANEISKTLDTLKKQSYESIMTLRSKGVNCEVLLSDTATPVYLFSFSGDGGIFLLEVEGNISGETLRSIASMDPAQALNFLNIAPPAQDSIPAPPSDTALPADTNQISIRF